MAGQHHPTPPPYREYVTRPANIGLLSATGHLSVPWKAKVKTFEIIAENIANNSRIHLHMKGYVL